MVNEKNPNTINIDIFQYEEGNTVYASDNVIP